MDLSLFSALIGQFTHSPAAILVILIVNVLVWAWEILPFANSRYIPILCLVLGVLLAPWFISRGDVDPSYPDPLMVILAQGLILGLVSFTVHAQVVKRFFVPVPETKTSTPPINP